MKKLGILYAAIAFGSALFLLIAIFGLLLADTAAAATPVRHRTPTPKGVFALQNQ